MEDYSFEELEVMASQGLAPTDCPEGCIVEPDGLCLHGYQSVLLEMGLI